MGKRNPVVCHVCVSRPRAGQGKYEAVCGKAGPAGGARLAGFQLVVKWRCFLAGRRCGEGMAWKALVGMGVSLLLFCMTVPVWAQGQGLSTGAAGANKPFPWGAGFMDFERNSGKIVGLYSYTLDADKLVETIAPGSVTHVLYAFLRLCGPGELPSDAALCQGKPAFSLTDGEKEKKFDAAFARLKPKAPHLKVLPSVGGWGGSDPIFHMAGDPARRAAFVSAVVKFLREHPSFDGVDIDWEHPGGNGAANGVQLGGPDDGKHYASLMHDLRHAFDELGRETGRYYLVTMAVNTMSVITERIDYKRLIQATDLVFMMTYDHYGGWSPQVGNHATLRSSSSVADDSLERALINLLAAGVPPEKLVAGVASYGRGFSGVKEPRTGAAKTGVYPLVGEGAVSYRDMVRDSLGPRGNGINGFKAFRDPVTEGWYLWNPAKKAYIGYEDPRAVLDKGRFVLQHKLAGVFSWEISQDNGDILNAMNLGVGNRPIKPSALAAVPAARQGSGF
jgi:chitinase